MRRLAITAALIMLSLPAFGFGKPEHSSVEVSAKAGATGDKEFAFLVKMTPDMVVNHEGPWKLEIKGHDGLTLLKTTFIKADLDDKLPGYRVTGKTDKPAGELEYSLTAFVCTKEKTQCFREVHAAKYAWTK